ncbi:MAG: VIT1/CCC1 transporter family protein [Bacteroidota bacterium]|nr:VIT1/CCC1 transporter family protein [Bacteroidota bacterium]
MENKKLITTLQKTYKREMNGAKIYRELAERESLKERKEILSRLAEAEEKHAEKWKNRLTELGGEIPKNIETTIGKIRRWLLIRTGTKNAIRRLEEAENNDSESYQKEAKVFTDRKDVEAIKEVEQEEKVHSKILHSITEPEHPQGTLDKLLSREKWHTHGVGGWVGQAIYGANDGLGAVFGIVSGMAGYSGGSDVVLIAGVAAALASSLSMGSGAYLARKSEKEVYQAEIERERKEIEENPEEEREELSLFYQLKGFDKYEADKLADKLSEQPEQMVKVLASEELGLSETTFPNPIREAFSAGISTAIGGIIPVIPFMFTTGLNAVIISLAISTLAHFAIGVLKTIVTGRGWFKSGLEMTAVGIVTAAIAYGLGTLLSPEGHLIP